MDLQLSDEQQQLVDSFGALYAKQSSTERVRAAEPRGHDPELWARLRDNGALDMAVPQAAGGWGADLIDLALVAEQHGRALGSAPMLEAQVAARLLAALPGDASRDLLEGALAGSRLVTVALHFPRRGTLAAVPAGALADDVLFIDGDRLCHAVVVDAGPGFTNIGSLPLADLVVPADAAVLAEGSLAGAAWEQAQDEWMALMAAAMVGLGGRAMEIGVEYVRERKAFGVPIGSFQAIGHGLADAATAVEGGTLLAREAAWSGDAEPARFPELAALAFGFCAEAAREASYRALHYHGGYGFMLEYDIQLFFRRAKAWPAQFIEPDAAYARAARHRLVRQHQEA